MKREIIPLSPRWIDEIFRRLTANYGRRFMVLWDGLDIEQVKLDWGLELAHYRDHPKAIEFALDSLPEGKAPDLPMFRALCRAAPAPGLLRLPDPDPDPAGVRKVAEAMAALKASMRPGGDVKRATLARLEELLDSGHRLTLVQVAHLVSLRSFSAEPAPIVPEEGTPE